MFYQKVFISEKHNYIDFVNRFSFNFTTCFGLLFRFRHNNHKFYNNRLITVCMEKSLPLFYSPCEAVFLNDIGRNRQPKHTAKLNRNQYKNNVSVNNTTLYFIYNNNSIFSGRNNSTFIRSSDVWLTVHRNSVWIRKTN